MSSNYQHFFEKDYQKILEKYDKKSEEYKQLKYEYELLDKKLRTRDKQLEIAMNNFEINAKAKYQPLLDKKDEEINELKNEINRLKSMLNLDGTNSGISTSKTPLNKKKVIPNTRVKSGKPKGGQLNHPKHKLEKFKDDEINENVNHTLDKCPCCCGSLNEIGEIC